MNRTQRLFLSWYRDQRHYTMTTEEWTYVAQLTTACVLGWGLGLVIGGIWLLSM